MRTALVVLALALDLALAPDLGCAGTPAPPLATPTTPPAGARYIVGGDSRDDASHVLPWAFREAKARGASGFLFLGDMELTPDLDAQFAKELPLLDPVPFYPALGNHEVRVFGFVPIGRKQAEQAFRDRFLGTPRTPITSSITDKVVYSVDLPGGLHFIALDNVSQNGFGDAQLAWLGLDLEHARADTRVRHVVVGMHKPLAHNGVSTHGMDGDGATAIADSDAALALLVKYRTSLIVASHVHEFAHFSQGGIDSYITGGLGAPLDKSGPDHAFHHFLQLDLTDVEIHVSVVRFDGKPTYGEEDPE
jgi:Calcineurin-like phosphoesterase